MDTLIVILIYVAVLGGFWFLLMRPQKKEQKRIQLMLAEMEVGDTVLTSCGFYGIVIDIKLLQRSNTPISILVTLFGIVIDVKLVHP